MIHFPALLYEVNQELKLIGDMIIGDAPIYTKGTKCVVEEIYGYGYDLRFSDGELIRFLNSELPAHFVKTDKPLPVKQRIAKTLWKIRNIFISAFHINPETTLLLDILDGQNGELFATVGTPYYYKTEVLRNKRYYMLYDPITHQKRLSMNEFEFTIFCSVPY